MSLRYGILGFLGYGVQTGYDLSKAFYASIDYFWHASTSQIYRELHAMEADGWVESTCILQTDKPNKKLYSITPKGKSAFQAWLSAPEEGELFPIRSVFLMRIFFSGGRPVSETRDRLRDFEHRAHQALLGTQAWRDIVDNYAPRTPGEQEAAYWRLAADYGRRYLEMNAEWAKHALEALKALEAEGTDNTQEEEGQ